MDIDKDNYLPVVNALIHTIEDLSVFSSSLDELVWPLIKIFHHKDLFFTFFDVIVKKEVRSCTDAGILFRKNSLVSKVFMCYARDLCADYLKSTLVSLILKIDESSDSYELDPNRIGEDEDVAENQQALLNACLNLLESLHESIGEINAGLSYCFHIIQRTVITKFPESANICIGGFYFLRMICPIIASGNLKSAGIGKYICV